MRIKWPLTAALIAAAIAAGAAVASHVVDIDPETVPVGFLTSHNQVDNFNVSSFARATSDHDADIFIQHAVLGANASTPWHTHPGPVIVTIVRGTLTYEAEKGGRCTSRTYAAGTGFFDPGFGHVHRAVAGAAGAQFYATCVCPTGSPTHLIPADRPPACA